MMDKLYLLTITLFAFCQFSCNPECEPVPGLSVTPSVGVAGSMVVLKASPLSALNDDKIQVHFNSKKAEDIHFHPELGLIVRVPEGVQGSADLRVSNPDCEQTLAFNVETNDFFSAYNKDFISPAVPEIYFPALPLPPFPPTLENAWLHPENTDYCLWFKFLKDGSGTCTSSIDKSQSFEQATCNPDPLVSYHKNPVFGTIDQENNIIHFWIDRTEAPAGNLGIEEYEGRFINIEDTGYKDWKSADCAKPFVQERNHMMWLTSKKTGRQLLIYQQALDSLQIPAEDFDMLIDCY